MKKKERIEALEREVQEIKCFINERMDELYGKTPFGKVALPAEEWKPTKGQLVKAWNDDPDDWCIAKFVKTNLNDIYIVSALSNYIFVSHISPIDSTTIEQLKERIK